MRAQGLAAVGVGALLLALPMCADARMHHPARGHRILSGASAPLDAFSTLSGAYSLRKVRTAYAGFAVRLRRADTTTQDIGFTGSGDFDASAATTFCTTACTVATWYDQSGLGRSLVQATAANQPLLVFECIGSLPCIQTSVNGGPAALSLSFSPFTPGGAGSLNVVARRNAGTGTCSFLRQNDNNNRITSYSAVANQWNFVPGVLRAGVADGVFHSAINVAAGPPSATNVDGVETTYSGTPSVVAGAVDTLGSTTATCQVVELVHWGGYALTAAERLALSENQRNYYTPYTLDTFVAPAGAYSMRRLKSTYSGPGIRLRRASDNAEADIGFLGYTSFTGAPLDTAAAAAHCAATTCFIATWYDQSGNARHLTHATPAIQPTLLFNCNGVLPCASFVAGQFLSFGGQTPSTVLSINSVARLSAYSSGGNACQVIGYGGSNWIQQHADFDITIMTNGSVTINNTSTRLGLHSHIGVYNGASSVNSVDGVEATGNFSSAVLAGSVFVSSGTAGNVCQISEANVWNSYALTAGERVVLQTNQKSFWGTP